MDNAVRTSRSLCHCNSFLSRNHLSCRSALIFQANPWEFAPRIAPKNRPQNKKTMRISNYGRCHRGSYPRRRWFDSTHRHQISPSTEKLILKIPLSAGITFPPQSFNSVDRNFLKLLIGLPSLLQRSPNIVGCDT